MTTNPKKPARKLHAFVIDDSKDMRDLLRRMLEDMAMTATDFRNGEAALEALSATVPDLIYADLKMAPMDGLAFTRAVRTSPDQRVRRLPVIMVSGFAERTTIEAAKEAGVSEFVAKPVAPNVLRARTAHVLRQQVQQQAAPAPVVTPAPQNEPAPDEGDTWLI